MADFERLFDENREYVFKYLVKLCSSAELAEELTQEAFFRAYMNLNRLRNEASARTWLCSIAKNAYFARLSEQKRLMPLDDSLPAVEQDAAEQASNRQLSRAAQRALHALEEPYRDVFTLAVFAEMPLKRISERFGKSESWARVTFYRARKKLMEELKDHEL